MTVYPIRTRRWTRAEYDRLITAGTFRPDERLELLGGELVVREPQGSRHAVAIELALRSLEQAPDRHGVCGYSFPWRSPRTQSPSPISLWWRETPGPALRLTRRTPSS